MSFAISSASNSRNSKTHIGLAVAAVLSAFALTGCANFTPSEPSIFGTQIPHTSVPGTPAPVQTASAGPTIFGISTARLHVYGEAPIQTASASTASAMTR
jgi:hypothetical protein